MGEKFLTAEFRDEQRRQFDEARRLTTPAEGEKSYNFLETSLEGYEKSLLDGKSMIDLVAEAHKRHPELPVSVLDYGCGHNIALRQLNENNLGQVPLEVTGMSAGDPRTEEEKQNDSEKNILFIDQQNAAFSLPDNSCDIIVSKMTFGHLANPLQVMKKLYRALRPGGELYIDLRQASDLAKRFWNDENSVVLPEKAVIDDLVNSGIDIRTDSNKFVIRKNDAVMKFTHVKPNEFGGYDYKRIT